MFSMFYIVSWCFANPIPLYLNLGAALGLGVRLRSTVHRVNQGNFGFKVFNIITNCPLF